MIEQLRMAVPAEEVEEGFGWLILFQFAIFEVRINFMKTLTLSVNVNDTLANRLSRLTQQELDRTMGVLEMVLRDNRSLEEVVGDMRTQAEKNGLTEEELEKILKELE